MKMKKFSFFLMGALAMAFAACEDAPETAPMQSNPQEPVLESSNVTAEPAGVLAPSAAGTVVALESMKGQDIEVMQITDLANVPAGAEVSYVFELSKNEQFDPSEDMAIDVKDGLGYVSCDSWDAAHVALFGKSPKEKDAYYRIAAYAKVDGVTYRIGGTDYYLAQGTVKETCTDQGFTISDSYYIIGNMNNWAFGELTDRYKFNHSSADVYDDPVFTIVVEVSAECYWKIAPQEAIPTENWNILYGPATDGDTALEGMLIGGTSGGAQSGKIEEAGKYRFTINMETMDYTIEPLTRPEYVAVPSDYNGWGEGGPRLYWSNKDDKPYFCGIAAVNNNDGGFKFIWDGAWYGGADGTISADGGNIPAPVDASAAYWFTVSTENLTYTLTEVTSVGVVGALNGWDNTNPVAMAQSADNVLIWSEDVELSGEWKVIINKDWGSNYGDPMTDGVPTFDGGNFSGYDGLHTVTLDCTGNKPVITITKK